MTTYDLNLSGLFTKIICKSSEPAIYLASLDSHHILIGLVSCLSEFMKSCYCPWYRQGIPRGSKDIVVVLLCSLLLFCALSGFKDIELSADTAIENKW